MSMRNWFENLDGLIAEAGPEAAGGDVARHHAAKTGVVGHVIAGHDVAAGEAAVEEGAGGGPAGARGSVAADLEAVGGEEGLLFLEGGEALCEVFVDVILGAEV